MNTKETLKLSQHNLASWEQAALRNAAHAEALAEALRGIMRAYCPNADLTAEAAGENALQSDVRKAREALARWEAK